RTNPWPGCYQPGVSIPASLATSRPATHWDSTVSETLSSGQGSKTWTIHVGDSFLDVPRSHTFYSFIERLLHFGVTAGCTLTTYCPDDNVFRLQMAVFIARTQAAGDANSPPRACAQR